MRVVHRASYLRVEEHTISFPLHTHESMIELEFMMEGGGSQWLNGRFYKMKRGCLTVLRPQDFHLCDFDKDARVLNVQVSPSFLSREVLSALLEYQGNLIAHVPEKEFEKVFFLSEEMLKEYESKSPFSQAIIKRQIEYLCYLFFRILDIPEEQKEKSESSNSLIEKAILFMRTDFSENPSLQETAERFHLNADYFALLFKKYTGKTYYSYLTEIKMEYAKKLTLESDLPISLICSKAGFGHEANFHRQFKKYFGVSAGKTRMEAKERRSKKES